MNALDQKPNSESRPTGVGPGDRLQAARIQQGLSLEDVANRMHLSASILEAIEENEFEEITAPIFVKGYLRAYARIVSLDEDEMIQQYVDYYSGEDPPISSTSNMAPELSVTDARIKWTTYLVVVVLIALLAAWWWNKAQNEEPVISLDTQPTEPEPRQQGSTVVGAEIEAVSENEASAERAEPALPESAPTPPQTAAVEAEPVAAADSAGRAAADEPPAESAAAAPVAADESLPADEAAPADASALADSPALADESTPEEPAPAGQEAPLEVAAGETGPAAPAISNAPALIAPSGDDRMQIVVIADSWADIKDANDYQMVYDLLRADQTLELTGAAPFSVFLGNGHGVEIRFNGEPIDFSGRIRNDNTARIKVGG